MDSKRMIVMSSAVIVVAMMVVSAYPYPSNADSAYSGYGDSVVAGSPTVAEDIE